MRSVVLDQAGTKIHFAPDLITAMAQPQGQQAVVSHQAMLQVRAA
jgi:hypothetical protein